MADESIKEFEKLGQRFKEEEKTLKVDFDELKAGGFIKQRQKDIFTVRLKVPGGRLPIKKLKKIIEVASKYSSSDYVHISVRQSIEIPYVNIKDFNNLVKELKEIGQEVASCGARVRVPTACSGCEYNPRGISDTQKFAQEVDKRYFGKPQHHKFKISFSGCPIDCARTREMDLGFQGEVEPKWEEPTCIGCRLCAKVCPTTAIISDKDTGKPHYYPDRCIYCGQCIKVCPSDSWCVNRTGNCVRTGGKHGYIPREANTVAHLIPDERVFDVIDKTLEWYGNNGQKHERIGNTIDRIGVSKYLEFMGDILKWT